ncbi:unnamed protein product, partial [Gadus morhua 'NCC']
MIQTNKRHGTKRVVRRRPRFLSSADVQVIRTSRRPPNGPPNVQAVPSYWDKTQVPETGYKKVLLQYSSEDYKEVETLFRQSMTDFDIVKIERIQNKSLWDQFQLQREQMKTRNGGRSVAEKKLFHSTDSKYIEDICYSNYDWRICGTDGTAYGKGSYFVRDASYSHYYTGNASTVHSMFVSRVLVGHHTRGMADYVRPPSKDGGDTLFYDSCTDDISSPSIFVVFEQPQIYPEFLLTYKENAAAVQAAAVQAAAVQEAAVDVAVVDDSFSLYGSRDRNRNYAANKKEVAHKKSVVKAPSPTPPPPPSMASATRRVRRRNTLPAQLPSHPYVTEICLFFLEGSCIHHARECCRAHYRLPYSWEVLEGHQWTLLESSEEIEDDYCDPKKAYSTVDVEAVCFDTMTCGLQKVRRLSSISSVLQPTFLLTTEWLWYWEEEDGNWNQYDIPTNRALELEKQFQNNPQEVVEFTAGSQDYTLSLQ